MWTRLRELDDASVCNNAGDEIGARLELAAKDSVGEAARQFPETRMVSPTEEGRDAGPHTCTPNKYIYIHIIKIHIQARQAYKHIHNMQLQTHQAYTHIHNIEIHVQAYQAYTQIHTMHVQAHHRY